MSQLPSFLLQKPAHEPLKKSREVVRTPFLEKGIHHLAGIIRDGYAQWEGSRRDGLLQRLDPRIKLFFLILFLVVVSLKREPAPQAGIALLLLFLAALSRLDIVPLYRRILLLGLIFGVLVPLPSLLNPVSGGEIIVPLMRLPREYHLWGFHLPSVIGITGKGLDGIIILALRVTNSVTISFLVLHTTTFPDLIKALRVFRVPDMLITVITLSYKYFFAFSRTVMDMHLAKKSRLVKRLDVDQSRQWAAGRMASLFDRTQSRCEDIFKAMLSRGFQNHATAYSLRQLAPIDWAAAVFTVVGAVLFLYW